MPWPEMPSWASWLCLRPSAAVHTEGAWERAYYSLYADFVAAEEEWRREREEIMEYYGEAERLWRDAVSAAPRQ